MNEIIKIYLDTSVINFLFADDAPEKKENTLDLFDNFIYKGIYEVFISSFVIDEIENTKDFEKRKKLLEVIERYPINFVEIEINTEIDNLANSYINNKVIPEKSKIDAYHIAVSVVNGIDYLVSWNYKHLANITKEHKVKLINYANNYYKEFRILTPLELISYEN